MCVCVCGCVCVCVKLHSHNIILGEIPFELAVGIVDCRRRSAGSVGLARRKCCSVVGTSGRVPGRARAVEACGVARSLDCSS